MDEILNKLERIEELLSSRDQNRNVLAVPEAAKFLNISESHLYRLTSQNAIPHYSPGGKRIYFKRTELEEYLVSIQKVSDKGDISETAKAYIDQKSDEYLMRRRS
jgi:excisionase family DNA binding protein